MFESIIIAAIVATAGWYTWKKMAKTMAGKKACCEKGEDNCAFKDFLVKEGGNVERLNCSAADRQQRLAKQDNNIKVTKPKESTA